MTRIDLKHLLIRISSELGAPSLFGPSPKSALTTLLFHEFFEEAENKNDAKERLRRECDWLKNNYTPLSIDKALDCFSQNTFPDYPLLVTADDAHIDLLSVTDIFAEFEIPLTIFICTGWVPFDGEENLVSMLTRILDFIYWYEGEPKVANPNDKPQISLGQNSRNGMIDRILSEWQKGNHDFVARLFENIQLSSPRQQVGMRCSWEDLSSMLGAGEVSVGAHTVTHPRLAGCSEQRIKFEVEASRPMIEDRLGDCSYFAYPYGTSDVMDNRTDEIITHSGYHCAFTTKLRFAKSDDNRFRLPRITIPDEAISLKNFQSHVRGGQIPFQSIKNFVYRGRSWWLQ